MFNLRKYSLEIGFGLLLIICIFNFFLYLGDIPIRDWDEARHGVSAIEMLETKNFIVNTYNYEVDYWNAKPPLSFWASSLGLIIFDNTLFGLRFFSAFFSCITVFSIVWFAAVKFSWPVGLATGAILVSLNRFVLKHNVRTADPDALFIMLSVIAILCVLCMKQRVWLFFIAVFLISLAFLTKGFHAAIPGCLILILVIFELRKDFFTAKTLSYSVLCFCVPVMIWAFFRYFNDGVEFFDRMLFYDVLKRAASSIEGHSGPFYYYLNIIIKEFRLTLLAIVVLYIVLCCVRRKTMPWSIFISNNSNFLYFKILFCIFFPIMIFSMASSKLGWYVYLTFPFISIVCAVILFNIVEFSGTESYGRNFKRNLVFFLLILFLIQEGYLIGKIIKQKNNFDFVQVAILEASQKQKNVSMFIEGDEWHQRFVLAAKLYGKFKPQSGGQVAWNNYESKGAVLILINGEKNAQIYVK